MNYEKGNNASACLLKMILLQFAQVVVLQFSWEPYKDSQVRKLERESFSSFINSISNSKKIDNKACHLANIFLEARFSTSFKRISFTLFTIQTHQ